MDREILMVGMLPALGPTHSLAIHLRLCLLKVKVN